MSREDFIPPNAMDVFRMREKIRVLETENKALRREIAQRPTEAIKKKAKP